MSINTVAKTERGWGGHFICADRCAFRRNTLLECNEVRVIVSTVGNMQPIHLPGVEETSREIGLERYYETMLFHAKWDGTYWDADVGQQIYTSEDIPWSVNSFDHGADKEANEIHESNVEWCQKRLEDGDSFSIAVD